MSENSVIGKAFRINEFDYFNCPKDVAVSCAQLVILGVVWFVPTSQFGANTGYRQTRQATKPTPDSVKTIRVRDNISGSIYYLLVNDNVNQNVISDICAECCGDITPLANVIIPTIIIEEQGCAEVTESAPTYRYFSVAPVGGRYSAVGSKNGVAFTPAVPGDGFASVSALRIWANANWGAYGTFTNEGQKLIFTSTDAVTGYINVTSGTPSTANAGPDQTLASGTTTTTLTSAATTAGTGTISSRVWSKVSGPGVQVIQSPNSVSTGVTGLQAGAFVFRISVTDSNGLVSTDDVSVVVAA